MKHLIVVLAAALVLVPAAGARMLGGPTPVHVVTAAPTGLRAFLLRPDETPQKYYPRTPSFSWNPVNAKGGTYDFELATSRSFNDASVLFSYTKLTIPAVAIAHQLPWMTGVPLPSGRTCAGSRRTGRSSRRGATRSASTCAGPTTTIRSS